jgi:hypothetical protein
LQQGQSTQRGQKREREPLRTDSIDSLCEMETFWNVARLLKEPLLTAPGRPSDALRFAVAFLGGLMPVRLERLVGAWVSVGVGVGMGEGGFGVVLWSVERSV